MKKIFYFILVAFFFFSCHKSKPTPVTCDSYSIGMTVGCNVTLLITSTNTGQVIKNYKNVIQLDGCGGVGVYDHIHGYYYLYGIVNTTIPILYRLNTNTWICDTLGLGSSLDTVASINNLICNSTTGKLYFFPQNYYTSINSICEITPNATGFSPRHVCNIPSNWGSYISSPVVDESSGYIYFLASSSPSQGSEYSLIKVNIASGVVSFVANTGVYPIVGLIYNNNDGMFYGANVVNTPLAVFPYGSYVVSYISIDPGTGIVNTIIDSIADYNTIVNTFDYCNNLYVFGYYGLEPSTGKLVKQFAQSAFGVDAGIY